MRLMRISSGPDRIRTDHPCNANAVLYQMSYGPKEYYMSLMRHITLMRLMCQMEKRSFILKYSRPPLEGWIGSVAH